IVEKTMAQTGVTKALASGVKDGSITIILKFLGLDDLTGTKTTAPFQLGILHGTPTSTAGYDGTADLDWWYTSDSASIDTNRDPKSALMNGKFLTGKLSSDPGTVLLTLLLGGSPATLTMKNTVLTATSDAASTPTSSSGATPGHLASENDDPAIKTFKSLSGGKLCGDITARSLQKVTLPMAFDGQCDEGYSVANNNSLLD